MLEKLKNMKIGTKIPTAAVAIVIFSTLIVSVLAYNSSKTEVNAQSESKLMAVLAARESQLSDYLGSIREDLALTATNPNTASAIMEFEAAWTEMGDGAGNAIYSLYKTDRLDKLYDAGDDSAYTQVHKTLHKWFHDLQQTRGYYDVFLFSMNGDLIYSVFKEADFATNMYSGEWKSTDLANVYKDAAGAS